MLEGLMQDDFQLTLHHPLHRMRSVHPGAEVVTLTDHGTVRASYGEVCRARRPSRARAGAARREAGRSRRHVRLEQPAPPRALHGRALRRRGAAHAQHPPVRRAAHLHRQPRRGRGDLRRRLARADPRAARAHVLGRAPLRRDGRRGCRLAAERAALRGAAGGGRPRALTTTPRSTSARPPRSATRAAPPATPRACSTRTARSACTPPPR